MEAGDLSFAQECLATPDLDVNACVLNRDLDDRYNWVKRDACYHRPPIIALQRSSLAVHNPARYQLMKLLIDAKASADVNDSAGVCLTMYQVLGIAWWSG